MDALSEVLRVVRLGSAVFYNARFSAPWCFASPEVGTVMKILHPGSERMVIFHLLTQGECRVEVDGMVPRTLRAGEIIVFPHGDAHRMASESDVAPAPPVDLHALLRRGPRELGPRREIHALRRSTPDALPHSVAPCARCEHAPNHVAEHHPHRAGGGLRNRRDIQSRLSARVWRSTSDLALDGRNQRVARW